MSRASLQCRAGSDGASDPPRLSHVSDGRVDSDDEADISDVGPGPSGLVPSPPAAELGTGQSKLNGASSATIGAQRGRYWFIRKH